jgi:hypothetical protein
LNLATLNASKIQSAPTFGIILKIINVIFIKLDATVYKLIQNKNHKNGGTTGLLRWFHKNLSTGRSYQNLFTPLKVDVFNILMRRYRSRSLMGNLLLKAVVKNANKQIGVKTFSSLKIINNATSILEGALRMKVM